MSCLGVDFGSCSTVVAVARKKGIDIVTNEVSNRLTPSIVVFGEERRYIGEDGAANVVSNFKSSVMGLRRLLERMYDDPDIEKEMLFTNSELVADEDGVVCAKVHVNGRERTFSFVQLAAMFFSEVNKFTYKDTGLPIKTVVISCPVWYTDVQKRAILDACFIVGIEPIVIINDLAAASLSYGITKFDLPNSKDKNSSPRVVVLFDMGYSSVQVCVSKFFNSHAVVASHAYDRNIGGRDIDYAMTLHYAEVIAQKHNVDILSNKKAMYRLRQACERVKKVLSANPVTVLNVECLVGDIDISIRVNRDDLETLVHPMIEKITKVLHSAMDLAGVRADGVDFIEFIGGSSRIPYIKKTLTDIFGHSKVSATLNMEEAVARGCAIQCAIASPLFKVRDYYIDDWNPYPLELHWDAKYSPPSAKLKNADGISTVAFPVGNTVPSTKLLTLARVFTEGEAPKDDGTYDFVIGVRYHSDIERMGAIGLRSKFINTFVLSGIKKLEGSPNSATIKAQLRLGQSGVVMMENAYQVEDVVKKVPVETKQPAGSPDANAQTDAPPNDHRSKSGVNGDAPSQKSDSSDPKSSQDQGSPCQADQMESDKMDTGEQEPDPESTQGSLSPPKQMKTVKVQVKHELSISAFGNRKTPDTLQEYIKVELELSKNDKLVIETADMRNTVEEYIYSSRSNISGNWEPFITPDEISVLSTRLSETEQWLYNEGMCATKDQYSEKYMSIRELGDKVQARYNEYLMEMERERLKKEEENKRQEMLKKEAAAKEAAQMEDGPSIEVQPGTGTNSDEVNAEDVAMNVSEPESDHDNIDKTSIMDTDQ